MKNLEHIAESAAEWVGSTISIICHTIAFIIVFLLPLIGLSLNTVLLVLTTIVSLEAIYLSIFVQMTVNKHSKHLKKHGKNLELLTKKKTK